MVQCKTMRIERLRREHIPALLEIENYCFAGSAWSEGGFLSELEKASSLFLVAMRHEQLCGAIAADICAEQAFISKLMVAPAVRRQGIARQLLRALENECRQSGVSELTLEVRAGNAAARALYESCAFSAIGERKNFYHEPKENAVIMSKYLKERYEDISD